MQCHDERPAAGPGKSVSEAPTIRRANVLITVSENARDRIHEVAAACRALGLEHTSTLADVGVLLGSLELDNLLGLWAVPGVLTVEIEGDSPIKRCTVHVAGSSES